MADVVTLLTTIMLVGVIRLATLPIIRRLPEIAVIAIGKDVRVKGRFPVEFRSVHLPFTP